MAAASASGQASVRVRLLFDYPPPGSPTCGLCWLLLEPNQVRFVTDLCSLIRDKFGFSRRSKLSLFLDGALLPPTESARLVRDNDSLRVKLEEVIGEDSYNAATNGFTIPSKKERKRQRQKLEAEDSNSEDEQHRTRKKSKRNLEKFSSQEENSANNQGSKKHKKKRKKVTEGDCVVDSKSDGSTSHSRKLKNRVNQEKKQEAENKHKKQKARTPEAKNTSQKTLSVTKIAVAKPNTKKDETSSESLTSSDSDNSVACTKQMLSHKTKVTAQHTQKPQCEDSPVKPISACKLAAKPKDGDFPKPAKSKEAEGQSSSSDSSSVEEEEQQSSNLKCKIPNNRQGTLSGPTSKTKPETSSSESDSSESETCTDKRTTTNTVLSQPLRGNSGNSGKKLSATTCGLTTSPSDAGRGRGRGEITFWRGPRVRGCRGMARGRGRGESPFFFNYNDEYQKQKQLNEAAANTSVIIQNPPEVPKKDYSTLPLLAAPPQVGEKIAFKLLELTENYTPEVSDYKEAKIISWNPTNKQLELEMLSFSVDKL
ncbi:PREDICTED: coilin isoform X2 [Gekko japonicus]|uniref:Coilin isoform X2 n=1 Tax=Gekko japonicus TaxID=146911 RepID=A0ABM1LC85_GEKJA|nr:PREDICTED: coilin isoform X2 [Gekko japonicus]